MMSAEVRSPDKFTSPVISTGQMNALRICLGVMLNAVAAVYFIASGLIFWTEAALIAAGTITGGYAGPYIARAVGVKVIRVFVSITGFVMGLYFLVR